MYTDTYNKSHRAVNNFINDPASLYRKNTGVPELAPTRSRLPNSILRDSMLVVCRHSWWGLFIAQILANATDQSFAFQRAAKHLSIYCQERV